RAVVDEATALSAQVRAGALDADQLVLAADAGYPPARVALGDRAPASPVSERWADLGPWVDGFDAFGREVRIRAAFAALDRAWVEWEPRFDDPARGVVCAWMRPVRAWVAAPGREHEDAARALLGERTLTAARSIFHEMEGPPYAFAPIDAALATLQLVAVGEPWSVGLVVCNARTGPDGRITAQVVRAIGEQVGRWALYAPPRPAPT
ncbi:MAG: hypothetical protein ABMB14_36735, partial [Myxococcota bacterium]